MIVLESSAEMNTAGVPVFAGIVLDIFYIVSGVSTLDGIEGRTCGLPFPEKTHS